MLKKTSTGQHRSRGDASYHGLSTTNPLSESEPPLKKIISALVSYAFREFGKDHAKYEEILNQVATRVNNLPSKRKRKIMSSFKGLIEYAGLTMSASDINLARLATAFGYWDFLIESYSPNGSMEVGPLFLASMPDSVRERIRIRRRVLRKSGLPGEIARLRFILMQEGFSAHS